MQIKTTVSIDLVSEVDAGHANALLAIFHQAQYNPTAAQEPGIRAASKLVHDAPDEAKIAAVIGEGVAYEIEKMFSETACQRIVKISYQETPAPRALPADAKPQVVEVKKP